MASQVSWFEFSGMLQLGIYGADGLQETTPSSGCFKNNHHQNLEKYERGICEEDVPEFLSWAGEHDHQKLWNY